MVSDFEDVRLAVRIFLSPTLNEAGAAVGVLANRDDWLPLPKAGAAEFPKAAGAELANDGIAEFPKDGPPEANDGAD